MSSIRVNDIFEELSEENKRLLNELMFANKCLNVLKRFKAFIDFNFNHLKTILDSNQSQEFEDLLKKVEDIFIEKENVHNVKINKILLNESLPTYSKKKKSINGHNFHKINDRKHFMTESNDFIINSETNESLNDDKSGEQFKCDFEECEKWFDRNTKLISHQKRCHSDITFECDWPGCHFISRTKWSLRIHVKRLHENRKTGYKLFVCEVEGCGRQFYKREQLNGHINKHKGIKPFVCEDNTCDKTFFSSIDKRNHFSYSHVLKDNAFKCEVESCGKAFKTNGQLISHSFSHNTTKVFECQFPGCHFKTHNRHSFYSHRNEKHNENRYKCPVEGCVKTLKHKKSLSYHLKNVHKNINDRPFVCDVIECGKTFKNSHLLKKHVLHMHSDKETLYCDWPECSFTTTSKGSLSYHNVRHQNKRQFVCDWPECGKRFNIKNKLQEHLQIHMGEKKYACSWPGCGYRCVFGGNLRKHMKVHQK